MHTVKWLNSSIWNIDGTKTSTTTLSQSGPESNGNEEVLHIPQSLRTETSLLNGLVSYAGQLEVPIGFILIGNGHGKPSSNPEQGYLHFTQC